MYDGWMCTRKSTIDVWNKPINLGPNINSVASDGTASLSKNKLIMVFASTRNAGQGKKDLWTCKRKTVDAPWSKPINLGPTINSKHDDLHPFFSADGLTLLFNSDRTGGQSDWDIWMSRRKSVDDAWPSPVNLGPPINSRSQESGASLTNDNRKLYFGARSPFFWDMFVAEIKTSPQTAPSKQNYALEFDGKSSYVSIPSLKYDGSHPITIEAWVTPKLSGSASRVHGIICNAENGGWHLWAGHRHWHFDVTSNGHEFHQSIEPVVSDQRTHVAAVIDGKNLRLFVDGRLQKAGVNLVGHHKPSSYAFLIGANPTWTGMPEHFFKGRIDEVRISKIVRYSKNFVPSSQFNTDQHTMALYHFNEGKGKRLIDASGNEHDGAIINAKWVAMPENPTGHLVIESEDPTAEVVIRKSNGIVIGRIKQGEIELKVDRYKLELGKTKKNLRLSRTEVTITEGTKVPVSVFQIIPLDKLNAADIPVAERYPWQPKNLVAVLGSHRWRHWRGVSVLALGSKNDFIASADGNVIRLWNTETGNELALLQGHK